jgi:hypothetical protein
MVIYLIYPLGIMIRSLKESLSSHESASFLSYINSSPQVMFASVVFQRDNPRIFCIEQIPLADIIGIYPLVAMENPHVYVIGTLWL